MVLMKWWDWDDPGFALTFVAAFAAAIIPFMVFWLGKKTEAQLHKIQVAQLELDRKHRRDFLLTRLPEESSPDLFNALTGELGDYSGHDLDLLRSARRQNPLAKFPVCGKITRREAEEYVRSLPRRLQERHGRPFPELLPFISLCHETWPNRAVVNGPRLVFHDPGRDFYDPGLNFSGQDAFEFKQLGFAKVLYEEAAQANSPGHQFYRAVVTDGSWRMAPSLLFAIVYGDVSDSGSTANILTGVLLAALDISIGRKLGSVRGWPREEEIAEFRIELLEALAALLHPNRLAHLGQWDMRGFTEATSAPVAWLIRAAGDLARGDGEYVERPIIENLADVVESLSGRDKNWGTDVTDVECGLRELARKCPVLWQEHGPRLIRATGVQLQKIEDGSVQ
jgi:hypothetical protein